MKGLRGVDHVGLTVPDLEAATAFFVDVLGAELIYDGGEIRDDPETMRVRLGVDPTASFRYRFLRLGAGLNLELFEYRAPDQRGEPPRNSDAGGHHLCLYVDDIDAAVAHLRRHDVRIMGEPETIADGPSAGSTWVYFLAPWGLQLELCSYPDGKAYTRTSSQRLWDPRRPEA